MTTKIMQRLAGKVSVLFIVALLTAAVGTYGVVNALKGHGSTLRPTAQNSNLSPSGVSASVTRLPLSFEPNVGQTDAKAKFMARGQGYTAFLTNDGAVIGLHGKDKAGAPLDAAVKLGFAGANQPVIAARERQQSYTNYMVGQDRSKWHSKVANYAKVQYQNLYPGIDAEFHGDGLNLEYDFVVAPGANTKAIRMQLDGAKLSTDKDGNLAVATALGTLVQKKPVIYQDVNGKRTYVDGSYQINDNIVTLAIADYDHSHTLIVDPLLSFSTFFGGLADEIIRSVAVDKATVYATGQTQSTSFPAAYTTSGEFQPNRNVNPGYDAFLSSIRKDGSAVNWTTFFGGSGNDFGLAVAVPDVTVNDPAGISQTAIFVVGQTFSADLNGATPGTYGGNGDGFYAEFQGNGVTLVDGPGKSYYIGGAGFDTVNAVAARAIGAPIGTYKVFIAGTVNSAITTTPAPFTTAGVFTGPGANGFVAQLGSGNPTTFDVVRYIGSSGEVDALGLALYPYDFNNTVAATKVVVAGSTTAKLNVPTGGVQETAGNSGCPGTNLTCSTYGGTTQTSATHDGMYGMFDIAGTLSTTFLGDIGGTGDDIFRAVAINGPTPAGSNLVVLGGDTTSTVATSPALASIGTRTTSGPRGGRDAVVVVLNLNGGAGALNQVNYIGGSALPCTPGVGACSPSASPDELLNGLTTDKNGYIYAVGSTFSTNFPVINPLSQSGFNGSAYTGTAPQAFITRLDGAGDTASGNFSSYVGNNSPAVLYGAAIDSLGNLYVGGTTTSNTFPTTPGVFQQSYVGGSSDAILVSMQFNDLVLTGAPVLFTETYGTATTVPASAAVTMNFSSGSNTCLIPGNTCSVSVVYNGASGAVSWLNAAIVGSNINLTVNNPGGNQLPPAPPGTYVATVTVNVPGVDTRPQSFTVTLDISGTFTVSAPCGGGSPCTDAAFAYTHRNAAPPAHTFTISAATTPQLPVTATPTYTSGPSGWFTVNTLTGPAGFNTSSTTNLTIALNKPVLDQAAINVNPFTGKVVLTSPGMTPFEIDFSVNMTGRLVTTANATGSNNPLIYNFNTTGIAVTRPMLLRAFQAAPPQGCCGLETINITSAVVPTLIITDAPQGTSGACLAALPGAVAINGGPYNAPSQQDLNTTDLNLPITITAPGSCPNGTYQAIMGLPGGAGETVVGSGAPVAAFQTVDNVLVTINIGNVFKLTGGGINLSGAPAGTDPGATGAAFDFGTYVSNSAQGIALPLPAGGISSTLNTTISPNTSGFNVVCLASAAGTGGTTPSTGYAGFNSGGIGAPTAGGNCGWFNVTPVTGNVSTTTSQAFTITLDPSAASLPTDRGGNATDYTGAVQFIPNGVGQPATASQTYSVEFRIVRQPSTVTIAPANPTFTTTIGAGQPAPVFPGTPCEQLRSALAEYTTANGVPGQLLNPEPYNLSIRTDAVNTYAGSAPTIFTTPGTTQATGITGGWLTVWGSGANTIGAAGADLNLGCAVNILNLAPGTYTAEVDVIPTVSVGAGPAGASPTGVINGGPNVPFSGCTNLPASLAGCARTVQVVTLVINPAPTLTVSPSNTFSSSFQIGSGTTPAAQIATLTNGSAISSIQNVTVTPLACPSGFLSITGAAVGGAGVTLAPLGTTTVSLAITPAGLALAPGNYSCQATVTGSNSNPLSQLITYNYTVIAQPAIVTVPGTLTQFQYQQGAATPAVQNLSVSLTTGSGTLTATPADSNGGWLLLNGGTAAVVTPVNTAAIGFTVGVNPVILNALAPSNIPYTGTVTLAVPGTTNTPVVLNVSVLVTAKPTLIFTPPTVSTFTYTIGGTAPSSQVVNVTTNSGTAGFTATLSCTGTNASSVTLNGGTTVTNGANSVPVPLTLSAATAGVTPGTANCNLVIASPGTSGLAPATNTSTTISFSYIVSLQPLLSVTPASAPFTRTLGSAPSAAQTFSVSNSSSSSTTVSLSGVPSYLTCSFGGNPTASVVSGSPVTLTCAVNTADPAANNPSNNGPTNIVISGSAPLAPAANTATIAASLVTSPTLSVSSNALTFTTFTQGNPPPLPASQTVTATINQGSLSTYASALGAINIGNGPINWFSVTQTGNSYQVNVNPAALPTLSTQTTFAGSFVINGVAPGGFPATIPPSQTVTVTWTVNPQPGITASVSSASFTTVSGSSNSVANVTPLTVNVSTLPQQGVPYTVTTQILSTSGGIQWLTVNGSTTSTSGTSNSSFTIGIAAAAQNLLPGTYLGNVVITASGTTGSPILIPVTLVVNPVPTATVNPTSLAYSHTVNFTTPVAQTLNLTTTNNLTPITPTPFTVAQLSQSGSTPASLLNIITASGTTTGTATATPISISYNASVANSLAAPATYGGVIRITMGAGVTTNPQTIDVPWTIVISPQPLPQATPSSLNFGPGGVTPVIVFGGPTTTVSSVINITSSSSVTPNVNYSTTFSSIGNWLTVAPTSGATPGSFTVTANAVPGGTPLAAGTYTGTITVTETNVATNPSITIPVSFTIQPPTISATPASIGVNQAQFLTTNTPIVLSSNGAAVAFSAVANSATPGWLSVTPASGTTNAVGGSANSATISINTNTLAPGTYTGVVTFNLTNSNNGSVLVPVTVTVPPPTTCTLTGTPNPINLAFGGTSTSPGNIYPSVAQTITLTPSSTCPAGVVYTVTSSDPTWLSFTSNGTGSTFTFNAFANTHTVSRTGTLTITPVSGSQLNGATTVTVTELGSPETLQQRQVRALYQSILNREPDSGGFTFWTGAGQNSLGTMADNFMTSSENLNNNAQTIAMYAGLLGRFPTISELLASPVVGQTTQGSAAAQALFTTLSTSTEFNNHYGAPTNANLASVLYGNLLQRVPTAAEATQAGFFNFSAIYTGNEYRNLTTPKGGDHSNQLYVTMLYLEILSRNPDATGFQFWLNIANSGGPGIFFQPSPNSTRSTMIGPGFPGTGFIGSAEFQGRFNP